MVTIQVPIYISKVRTYCRFSNNMVIEVSEDEIEKGPINAAFPMEDEEEEKQKRINKVLDKLYDFFQYHIDKKKALPTPCFDGYKEGFELVVESVYVQCSP